MPAPGWLQVTEKRRWVAPESAWVGGRGVSRLKKLGMLRFELAHT
jgi:hypothetical protein